MLKGCNMRFLVIPALCASLLSAAALAQTPEYGNLCTSEQSAWSAAGNALSACLQESNSNAACCCAEQFDVQKTQCELNNCVNAGVPGYQPSDCSSFATSCGVGTDKTVFPTCPSTGA